MTSTAAGTRLPYTHPQERTKAFPFAVSFLQNSPFTGYGERAFFERMGFPFLVLRCLLRLAVGGGGWCRPGAVAWGLVPPHTQPSKSNNRPYLRAISPPTPARSRAVRRTGARRVATTTARVPLVREVTAFTETSAMAVSMAPPSSRSRMKSLVR